MIDRSDMPTTAGGTGAIDSDRIGNHVALDESFPFLPTGWQAECIGDQFILGPGPQAGPQSQQMGNAD